MPTYTIDEDRSAAAGTSGGTNAAPPALEMAREDGRTMPATLPAVCLMQALAQVKDSVLVTDAQGIVQYVNPAFVRASGLSAAEMIGRTPRILRSRHHDEAFYAHLWRTLAAGKDFRGLMVNRRADGSIYCEDQTIHPVADAQGRTTHYVATGHIVDSIAACNPDRGAEDDAPCSPPDKAAASSEGTTHTPASRADDIRNLHPTVPVAFGTGIAADATNSPMWLTVVPTPLRPLLYAAASQARAEAAPRGILVTVDHVGIDATARLDPGRVMQLLRFLLHVAVRWADSPGVIGLGARPDTTPAGGWVLEVRSEGFSLPLGDVKAAIDGHPSEPCCGPTPCTHHDGPLCRPIVAAHGGTLATAVLPEGGVCFSIMLPGR